MPAHPHLPEPVREDEYAALLASLAAAVREGRRLADALREIERLSAPVTPSEVRPPVRDLAAIHRCAEEALNHRLAWSCVIDESASLETALSQRSENTSP